MILADVFEKFLDTCLKFYKLYPCHYFSSPGLSWDAMLKITGIEFEQISDFDMYLFSEQGLRREITYICKRFSEPNNKGKKNYDPIKQSKYITYLDENNLYRRDRSGYLVYGGLKWLKNVDNSISENSSTGYILEVDLEYPLMNYIIYTMIVH